MGIIFANRIKVDFCSKEVFSHLLQLHQDYCELEEFIVGKDFYKDKINYAKEIRSYIGKVPEAVETLLLLYFLYIKLIIISYPV